MLIVCELRSKQYCLGGGGVHIEILVIHMSLKELEKLLQNPGSDFDSENDSEINVLLMIVLLEQKIFM